MIRELNQWYKGTLIKYQDMLKIKDKTIEKLSHGFLKRIEIFEKHMKDKDLIIEND